MPLISVIVPTHNPHPGRLRRVLQGFQAQTLPFHDWEIVIVDNASSSFPDGDFFQSCAGAPLSIVHEPTLGLTWARRRGLAGARGNHAVLVDDDNVLAPGYLAEVTALFQRHPHVGSLGGKSVPEFEAAPPDWAREFFSLLAVRDPGPAPLISAGLQPAGATRNAYPAFAPIGAGMALRREAWAAWIDRQNHEKPTLSDRRGSELTSGGDNDIVLSVMRAGWEVGYFPTLSLLHLIPVTRLEPGYLARLNRGIQQSWMQVLTAHNANPWPPLTPTGAALRKAKAWFGYHAWSSPAAQIRWQGACGHFAGRVPASK